MSLSYRGVLAVFLFWSPAIVQCLGVGVLGAGALVYILLLSSIFGCLFFSHTGKLVNFGASRALKEGQLRAALSRSAPSPAETCGALPSARALQCSPSLTPAPPMPALPSFSLAY